MKSNRQATGRFSFPPCTEGRGGFSFKIMLKKKVELNITTPKAFAPKGSKRQTGTYRATAIFGGETFDVFGTYDVGENALDWKTIESHIECAFKVQAVEMKADEN